MKTRTKIIYSILIISLMVGCQAQRKYTAEIYETSAKALQTMVLKK